MYYVDGRRLAQDGHIEPHSWRRRLPFARAAVDVLATALHCVPAVGDIDARRVRLKVHLVPCFRMALAAVCKARAARMRIALVLRLLLGEHGVRTERR